MRAGCTLPPTGYPLGALPRRRGEGKDGGALLRHPREESVIVISARSANDCVWQMRCGNLLPSP